MHKYAKLSALGAIIAASATLIVVGAVPYLENWHKYGTPYTNMSDIYFKSLKPSQLKIFEQQQHRVQQATSVCTELEKSVHKPASFHGIPFSALCNPPNPFVLNMTRQGGEIKND
jgi:hypothetical protein